MPVLSLAHLPDTLAPDQKAFGRSLLPDPARKSVAML
jgi:hypothetical protein